MLHPRENVKLFGHLNEKDSFIKVFQSGRIAHAWIITGPAGIGKATFSYHMARYILSRRSDGNVEFSPNDPLCRRITSQSHGDLNVLDDEETTEISVDAVRRLNQSLNQTSAEGGWRVVVIDGADKLNRNAANALLKRLEEPPSQTLFFLITPFLGRLLPTIRSRCQVLSLNPLNADDVQKVLASQNVDIPPFLSLSQGSPGRLMRLMEGKGSQVYEDLQGFYAGKPTSSFAHTYGSDEESFDIVEDLLRNFLHTQLLEKVSNRASFFDKLTMEKFLEVYEKVEKLFEDCRMAQLDRKATLTCVLENLKDGNAA